MHSNTTRKWSGRRSPKTCHRVRVRREMIELVKACGHGSTAVGFAVIADDGGGGGGFADR